MVPNTATPRSRPAPTASATLRDASRASGSTGSAVRDSIRRKSATAATAATTSAAVSGEVHGSRLRPTP